VYPANSWASSSIALPQAAECTSALAGSDVVIFCCGDILRGQWFGWGNGLAVVMVLLW
jgi:hypothetical protein